MECNTLFHEKYHLKRFVGRSRFSESWLAEDVESHIEVILKTYDPFNNFENSEIEFVTNIFSSLASIKHKNLLCPLCFDICDCSLYLVLPYCKKGDLLKLEWETRKAGGFSEDLVWHLIHDVADALAYLHSLVPPVIFSSNVLPSNILCDKNGIFLLTDFWERQLDPVLRKGYVRSGRVIGSGNQVYCAPECFGRQKISPACNIYSLGTVVYESITGDLPFGEHGALAQCYGASPRKITGNYSSQLKKGVELCLRQSPEDRPTAVQLEQYASAALAGKKIKFININRQKRILRVKEFFQKMGLSCFPQRGDPNRGSGDMPHRVE